MLISQVLVAIAIVFAFISVYCAMFNKDNRNPANYSWSGYKNWSWWFWLGWASIALWLIGMFIHPFVK
jgi:formate-dependent nitrite reductase membrane component NrfD